jgi:hypothetical protein
MKREDRIPITAEIQNMDQLTPECAGLLQTTLDVKSVSGRWNTAWNSTEAAMNYYDWEIETGRKNLYMDRDDDFEYIVVNMNQTDFEDDIQFDYETTDQKVEFQMRRAVYDGDNNEIPHLTQEWTQVIQGNGRESPCSLSTITVKSNTADISTAFPAVNEYNANYRSAHFSVEKPLTVKFAAGDLCEAIRFKLKMKTPEGDWVYFDEFKEHLEQAGFEGVDFWLWFEDGLSGEQATAGTSGRIGHSYLSGGISHSSYLMTNAAGTSLKKYLTDSNGDVALYFQVFGIVPGSQWQGPQAANDQNVARAEFKVVIVDEAKSSACANN